MIGIRSFAAGAVCFRWVKPAASLKHAERREGQHGQRRKFPLGKTGGLIEAYRSPPVVSNTSRCFRWVKPAASLKHPVGERPYSICAFPLGKTGGLIEAKRGPITPDCCRDEFPLGKTGGLIEALPNSLPASVVKCFRWVKPAASLKRE